MNYIPGMTGPVVGAAIETNYPTAQQAMGSKGSDHRKGLTTGFGSKGADTM